MRQARAAAATAATAPGAPMKTAAARPAVAGKIGSLSQPIPDLFRFLPPKNHGQNKSRRKRIVSGGTPSVI